MTVIEIIICLFLPWLAVIMRKGLCKEAVYAFLLQLLGHIPGVIYGLYVIAKNPQSI